MASIVRFIERQLRLTVNPAKSAVAKPEERHFLGFRLRRKPLSGEVEVLLSKRSRDRIDDRIRSLTPRSWGQALTACIQRLNEYLRGWIQFFQICTDAEASTLHALDAHTRRRLRAIVLRHWKRKRYMVRRLIRRGVSSEAAQLSIYGGRKSWWALSITWAVHRGLRNGYFARLGLVSLEQRWTAYQASLVVVASRQLRLELG
jgi:hypothetical protein